MECDGFPTGYLKCYIRKYLKDTNILIVRLGHDLSKIQSETENKKITRDGTNFSLIGKKKHEEQTKN
jgi:hypothetical protein